MLPRIPEKNKKAGVCYAVTDDGLELPVIDVTNPAFEVSFDERGLEALLQQFLQDVKGQEKTPAFLRQLMFSFMRKRSVIMRGLMVAAGTFMSGMNTYMMKLGADNLNDSYFSDIDRRIAASSAGTYMRLRLQDIAHLIADALIPLLKAREGAALHLLNIGGGCAIDSLNTLILIRKEQSELLTRRQIHIHSLDLNTAGPDFGARALESLLGEGAPLQDLQIKFQHVLYDWADTTGLRNLVKSFVDRQNILAVSSEGALFEYGIDEHIIDNLKTLNEITPADTVTAGSVTRADELGRIANGTRMGSRAAIQFRGLEAFSVLALRAGWVITTRIDRPLSHDILMKKV